MKYGIYLPNFGPDVNELVAMACNAEASGWDGFFLWDHIAGFDQPIADPWVTLGAVAARTDRIRIGMPVTPLPRRRPWKVARETVSVERLSGGRLIFGVGIGGGEAEWGHLGEETDLKTRGAMLDEGLEVLTQLWTSHPVKYRGTYYHVEEAHFRPGPIQQPRIPIWVGGFWPNKPPFRRAARWDGVFPLFRSAAGIDDEVRQIREVISFIQDHREDDRPFDVVAQGITRLSEPTRSQEKVLRFAEAGATWWFESIAPFRFGQDMEGPWPTAQLQERILAGPPKG
jgi:alkanesulfonate monooxygenase SsuD/methylene tetrahydromethanopterin reductase-like flavin-dependent oxidoreductase (luciferase family)